jgi:Reverse transcriptase (RNA-dependent DNA polymerase)
MMDWSLHHIDIKTAFLNGPLDEELYMWKPDGLRTGFWQLLKGLYGLHQAGRQWYLHLNERFEAMGFKQTDSDWSVHQRFTTDGHLISATSVDNILLASSSKEESNRAAKDISQVFETSDAEDVEHLLGCRITHW